MTQKLSFAILVAVFYCLTPLHAQHCDGPLQLPAVAELPEVATFNDHHKVPHLLIPGESLTAKSEYVLTLLATDHPLEMNTISLSYGGSHNWSYKSITTYRQYIEGVPLMNHRILCTYDEHGRLESYDVDVLLDEQVIADLSTAISQLPSIDHYKIHKDQGEYKLVYFAPAASQVMCDFTAGGPSSVAVSFPVHSCEFVDVAVADVDYLGLNDNKLCGKYANTKLSNPYNLNQYTTSVYTSGSGIPPLKEAMCHYFLNTAYEYLNDYVQDVATTYGPLQQGPNNTDIIWYIPTDVRFDSDVSDSGIGFNILLDDNFKTIQFVHDPSAPNIGCGDRIDLSEDSDWIVAAAIEQYFKLSGVAIPLAPVESDDHSEGMFQGIVGFMNWHMNTSLGWSTAWMGSSVCTGSSACMGAYAASFSDVDAIILDLDNTKNYDNHLNGFRSQRYNGSLFATTLREVYLEINRPNPARTQLMYKLIFQNMTRWGDNTNAFEAAMYLYEDCVDLYRGGELSASEFCAIEDIIYGRIGDHDRNPFDNISFPDRFQDYYIKDTYEGQVIHHDIINGEDVGSEPNEASIHLWESPDIVNCLSDDLECSVHEEPEYVDDNTLNYIYVTLRNRGCRFNQEGLSAEEIDFPFEGQLKVYASLAGTHHKWDEHWGREDGSEDYVLESTGKVAGRMLASIDLQSQSFHSVDLANQTFTYQIPWIPFNPAEFNDVQPGLGDHVCILARIVSDTDPMWVEEVVLDNPQGPYIKPNNNVAMKNMSIKDGSGLVEDDGSMAHVILRPAVPADFKGGAIDTRFTLNMMRGEGVEQYSDIAAAGSIAIRFSQNMTEQLQAAPKVGWYMSETDPREIIVDGPDFRLDVALNPEELYIAEVKFYPTSITNPIVFHLVQSDPESGCVQGGFGFEARPSIGLDFESRMASSEGEDILISPNPFRESIWINVADRALIKSAQLYDLSGNLVKSIDVTESRIAMSGYASGVYMLMIEKRDGSSITKKLVKI